MLPMQVALVPYEDAPVDHSRLLRVAAALQTQVERDLGPIWDVCAVVAPFLKLEDEDKPILQLALRCIGWGTGHSPEHRRL